MPRKRSPCPYSPGAVLKNRCDALAMRGSASALNRARISAAVDGAALPRLILVVIALASLPAPRHACIGCRGVSGTGPVMACCAALRPSTEEVFDDVTQVSRHGRPHGGRDAAVPW